MRKNNKISEPREGISNGKTTITFTSRYYYITNVTKITLNNYTKKGGFRKCIHGSFSGKKLGKFNIDAHNIVEKSSPELVYSSVSGGIRP